MRDLVVVSLRLAAIGASMPVASSIETRSTQSKVSSRITIEGALESVSGFFSTSTISWNFVTDQ